MEAQNVEIEIQGNNNENKSKENSIPMQLITKESSLDSNLFINSQISDYRCVICENIPSPENAYEAVCCPILFCKNCLTRWIYQKPRCPLCKKIMRFEEKYVRSIKDGNKIFYKMFQKFKIKCPYGCDWVGIWGDLENHLLSCDKGVRECKFKYIGCEYINEKVKIEEHEKNNDKLHLDLAMKFIKYNYKEANI